MKRDPHTILLTIGRSLRLKCPVCGKASIVGRPFNLRNSCAECGTLFKREPGFFVGAIMANVVVTEVVIVLTYFACLLFTSVDERLMLALLFVIGVSFPLAFYHHSWALWLGLDYLIEGLPKLKGGVTQASNGNR